MHEGRGYRTIAYAPQPSGRARTADRRSRGHGRSSTNDWYELVRRSAPFQNLDRSMFDAVIGMMTGAYNSESFSAFRPPLQYNEEAKLISARPGAQRLAVTSGGTIPDRGMYAVVLPEEGSGPGPRRVGELDEEMVYESAWEMSSLWGLPPGRFRRSHEIG